MGLRLLQAMSETSLLLGADPTRTDYLRAAAGVAGGGITLALALGAVGVVRGRWSYLSAALGVLGLFTALPFLVYTSNAGIVAAPLPDLGAMVQPSGWPRPDLLALAFWTSAAAFLGASVDLLYRSLRALRTLVDR